ncbi:MAG TPA: Ni/Fe-hydrogenase, b-type cytochrome subunit [Vicinamibacterales bacterium]|nr:Ni/Fe-hydrogenase, b-type cytochrome subunit [Vicinamibacterales bacterium]
MNHAAVQSEIVPEIVPVYVWQVPVRVTHWLIALSIVVLSITGIYIGNPFITVSGPAGEHFLTGWAKVIHGYTAYVFIASVLARIIWMFTGNNYATWDKFVPVYRPRRKGLLPTALFYLFAKKLPPTYVGHNPLAGGAYALVFGLYFLAMGTGLVMRGASAGVGSAVATFASLAPLFGGLQMARWIHHIVMWLLLGFAVHHIYSSILVAIIEKNGTLDSIFAGYKWVHREALGPGPYRWLHKGELDE